MFALMTHKTEELYDAALAKLLGAYTDRFPDKPIRIVNAMWDYEKAIQNALRTAFPGCDVHGCNFHYGQVIKFLYITIFFLSFIGFLCRQYGGNVKMLALPSHTEHRELLKES